MTRINHKEIIIQPAILRETVLCYSEARWCHQPHAVNAPTTQLTKCVSNIN